MPPVAKGKDPTLQIRQLWEGTVTEVHEDEFVAMLSDKSNPQNPNEQATFQYIEVSDDDRSLVKPGSVFYWAIGTQRTPAGQVKNVSGIDFQRAPAWTRGALSDAFVRARRIAEWFHVES